MLGGKSKQRPERALPISGSGTALDGTYKTRMTKETSILQHNYIQMFDESKNVSRIKTRSLIMPCVTEGDSEA